MRFRVLMRKPGSCRFEPYFKVQFQNHIMAWQDVQKAFATEEKARAAFVPGKVCRVMRVTEKGREPVPQSPAMATT